MLRDEGMSYGDYVEQFTYLLFLKMADERSKPPFNMGGESPSPILKGYDWPSLLAKDGASCLTTTATRWKSWGPRMAPSA